MRTLVRTVATYGIAYPLVMCMVVGGVWVVLMIILLEDLMGRCDG